MIDETAAVAIAWETARAQFPGQLELLGVSRIGDKATRDRVIEILWREASVKIPRLTIEDVEESVASRPVPPQWSIGFLVYSPEFEQGMTVASVTIDDESGAMAWEITPRPVG